MSDHSIPFTEILRGLPATTPFVGPEALERGRGAPFALRLGANESPFGVSPRAAEAMRAEVERLAWYADPEGHDLRGILAARHGVTPAEICLGAGIDELLGLIVRMVIEPGQPVVTSLGAYPTFNYHVAGFGGRLETVPYRDDREDLEGLLDAIHRHKAPLAFLANPDNPMGSWHGAEAVAAFIEALPPHCLLVLDEAYVEFAPDDAVPGVDCGNPQVIRMRTFSKAHGLAGARIGYALGNAELIVGLGKIRNHFGVNRIAQIGALASLGDPDFVAGVVAAVTEGKRETAELAERLGFTALPSATNFMAIDVGSGDRARAILAGLAEEGVFIRMPGVAPLDRCIRVTIGKPEERARFAEALERVAARVA